MKCWECDKEINKLYPIDTRVFCEKCRNRILKENEEDLIEYLRLKNKLMVNRAIKMLENQMFPMYEYEDAIKTISEYAREHPQMFMSSHEVIAAIVLVENRIKIKLQAKVGNMQVDFLIDEFKCILEIDGYMHKYQKVEDTNRELRIKPILGYEWETVRIPTQYIEKNAVMMVEYIKAALKEKRANKL